ncbi:PREDICTED: pre-mRNA-splicing factor cwc24-like [Camelina sativa]|uniref:Pre-mRNA-splicing factor cwc24-like n=1 Tax=Camelina sativa TaxID=90675 RepID=A0ABM0VJ33_CAMSA|nr:PREDICTED: pre-mRNA-splicing factor cwc24-like [Camelina sativa]
MSDSKSRDGDMTKNSKRRILDADEVGGSKNESSRLENLEKKDKKQTSRKLDLDADEDGGSKNESSRLDNLKKKDEKQTSRKLDLYTDFEPTEEENDALPLDCSICKNPFFDPVVTNCQHYFCEKCALMHHTENINCFVCNEPTLGVFSIAVEVEERIEEEREKARAMVKEVSEMLRKASVMNDDAKGAAERAVKMVAEIETMVKKMAAMAIKAEETATMAAEMVQEAEYTMETAKANMAKAFAVMRTVSWDV